ncbi:MAG TPA: hypothetical protein VGK77_04690 [Candidatus Binatia bacterium]|jgi:hypothetical protein
MKALEERLIDAMVQSDPARYRRNGSRSKARYLKSSLGAIPCSAPLSTAGAA